MIQLRWRNLTATTIAASLMLAGCGESDDDGNGTPADATCPSGEYGVQFTPADWTAGFVSMCHNADQTAVLLINTSAVFLDIAPGDMTSLDPVGHPQDATFANLVSQELVERTPVALGHAVVPPGGWVVAEGDPASVLIGLSDDTLIVTYAANKFAAYVQSRLTTPDRAMAQRVATCVVEIGTTWDNTQDPSVDLDYLLADTALGAGTSCAPLISEISRQPTEPLPPPGVLQDEFTRFKSGVSGSVLDDLLRMARNYVQVLR